MKYLVVLAFCASACVSSTAVVCDDGTTCPQSYRCLPAGGCAAGEQLDACAGKDEGAECEYSRGPGHCVTGLCIVAICGDNIVQPPEACDDGNNLGGDGCNGSCTSDETCGNGILELEEECDCGDAEHMSTLASCGTTFNGGDRCTTTCVIVRCGNGIVEPGEVCDDGDQVSGNGCNYNCTSAEVCGNGIIDQFVGEVCDDGDTESNDGCASQCQPETLTWRQWDPTTTPPVRAWPSMAYDAARGRVVLFGGESNTFAQPVDDTWEWDGSAWQRIDVAVRPLARSSAMMAYDAKRKRVVLFGGFAGDDLNDTWEWDGLAWSHATPATSPPARKNGAMAYDSARGVTVLFGGSSSSSSTMQDTWTWDGTNWTQMSPAASPPARANHAMAFDPITGAVLLFGGAIATNPYQANDTWLWNGSNWSLRTPVNKPQPRNDHTVVYDSIRRRVIVFGGNALSIGTAPDVWEWNGTDWADRTPASSPPGRLYHAAAFDQLRGRMVVFGGRDDNGVRIGDTQLWDGTTWTQPTHPFPSIRRLATGTYDAARGKLVVFGGSHNTNVVNFYSDTWEWDGRGWTNVSPVASVDARVEASMAYDAARKKVVMFGGGVNSFTPDNATWEWDGTTWTKLTTATAPPLRSSAAMTYDARRKVIVLFGGVGGSGRLADTWEYNGTTWVDRTPTTSPPARNSAAMAYDVRRGVTVLFGGFPGGGNVLGDTWEWDGTTWTERTPTLSPPARGAHGMAYDSSRGTVFMYAGYGDDYLDDLWEWNGTTWTQRSIVGAPTPRERMVFAYDAERRNFVVYGGDDNFSGDLADTWTLRYVGDGLVEACIGPDTDGDALAGCADDDCYGSCHPLCAPGDTNCDTAWPRCGDGVCAGAESCRLCPQDCTCTPVCGDFFCDTGETNASCPGDCP